MAQRGSERISRHRSSLIQNPKTLPVTVAGRRYFDLGRNASYEAAKAAICGDTIGSRLACQ